MNTDSSAYRKEFDRDEYRKGLEGVGEEMEGVPSAAGRNAGKPTRAVIPGSELA